MTEITLRSGQCHSSFDLRLHFLPMTFDAVTRARLFLLSPSVSEKEIRTPVSALPRSVTLKTALRIRTNRILVSLVTEWQQWFGSGPCGVAFRSDDLPIEP